MTAGLTVAGRPHRRNSAEEAPEPCLAVGAIGSRSNNLRHERQRTPFFVSEHLLVAGPHDAGQEGVATGCCEISLPSSPKRLSLFEARGKRAPETEINRF